MGGADATATLIDAAKPLHPTCCKAGFLVSSTANTTLPRKNVAQGTKT